MAVSRRASTRGTRGWTSGPRLCTFVGNLLGVPGARCTKMTKPAGFFRLAIVGLVCLGAHNGQFVFGQARRSAYDPALSPRRERIEAHAFSNEKIEPLRQRERLSNASVPRTNPSEATRDDRTSRGWFKASSDPTELVNGCPGLKIKTGYVLRSYVYSDGPNAESVVWALPSSAQFPDPDPRRHIGLTTPPRPPEALSDFIHAIEGDGSPWSYLAASILERELGEFIASWHGIRWGRHRVLDEDPFEAARPRGSDGSEDAFDETQWEWVKPKPKRWRPTVRMQDTKVTVTFYTYSGLGRQTIYRDVDRYTRGKYQFETELTTIAQGPNGYVF